MLKCDICGRTFKKKSALGGHMANAHSRLQKDTTGAVGAPTQAGSDPAPEVLSAPGTS